MCKCGLKRPSPETEEENMKHINTKEHLKYVSERYNKNPEFWDKVYKEHNKNNM